MLSYLIAALSRLPLVPSAAYLYSPRLQGVMQGSHKERITRWGEGEAYVLG